MLIPPLRARRGLLALGLILGTITISGCSSKPAETDTAEVSPDPTVKPTPAPDPLPVPTPGADGATTTAPGTTSPSSPPAQEPKP